MAEMIIRELNTALDGNEIFLSLRDERNVFFLDSGMDHGNLGKYSFIGCNPVELIKAKDSGVEITSYTDGKPALVKKEGNPFDYLNDIYKKYETEYKTELPFIGGLVGYLSYDLCHFIEKLPRTTIDEVNIPDMYFGVYKGSVVIDHVNNKKFITDINDDGHGESRLEALIHIIENADIDVKSFRKISDNKTKTVIESNFEKEDYKKAITKVKDYIRSGDIYQVNMTQRFKGKMNCSAIELYEKLRAINPAPFAIYMDFDQGQIVSSSPERFIKVEDGRIETRPIKGTRRRGSTPEEDEIIKAELQNCEKDRSELLMIVDLERNDLSKIAKTGTVEVTELFALEQYATVHHLVSTIQAEIEEGLSPIDVIKATFPGGSITGAPKIRAMEIIDELEPTSRNIYTGSIGYIGFNGDIDLNIVIRTFVCKDGEAYFQAGGGIVWDSDEESEYIESLDKARALKRALNS